MGNSLLDELIGKFDGISPDEKARMDEILLEQTSGMKFIPNPGPQTDAWYCEADILLYGGQAGGGKLLRLDEPIPVPGGWTTMGQIQPGQELFDEKGMVCHVTAISEINPAPEMFRLTFDDGSAIEACADHQWLTWSARELDDLMRKSPEWRARRRAARPSRAKGNKSRCFRLAVSEANAERDYGVTMPQGSIRTTREISASVLTRRGRRNHAIPVAGAVELPQRDLPIEPYVLGAWLGDGTSASAGFTSNDPEIIERLRGSGYLVTRHGKNPYSFYIKGLSALLRSAGLLDNKHIPPEYLRASIDQRLELLKGLMDTDGTVSHSGGAEFCNTNPRIIEGIHELILSLGWRATVRQGRARLRGVDHGPKWTIKWTPDVPVFHLSRKRDKQKMAVRRTTRFRYLVSCEPVASSPGRCIQVSSESRLYLAGRSFLPTHNSGLVLGLALTEHKRSLIMRRLGTSMRSLIEEAIKFNGTRDGYSGAPPPSLRTTDNRLIEFGSAKSVGDEEVWQGQPHDLIALDEATQFAESQVRFLMGWLRSDDPHQRCRMVLATNPPLSAEGEWVNQMFAAWLDPGHSRPAKPGELRWYITNEHGKDEEVEGSSPVPRDGKMLRPLSRTFIPARLDDNPFYGDDYKAKLDAMQEPMRSAIRDGNFMGMRVDHARQIIPSDWVRAAQKRWIDRNGQPPRGIPMCAMAVDIAQGGDDDTVLASRYDGFYPALIAVPGKETPLPGDVVGLVVAHRRDACPVIPDMGGGYGGGVLEGLKNNDIPCRPYNGSDASTARTRDKQFGFYNKRSETLWKFREALDPEQPGGSVICLPDDPILFADLTATRFEVVTQNGISVIKAEPKTSPKPNVETVSKRLGRSPDRGDAVVTCWTEGTKAANLRGGWTGNGKGQRQPTANMGHDKKRRQR